MLAAVRVRLNEASPFRLGLHGGHRRGSGLGLRALKTLVDSPVPAVVRAAADRAGNGGACLLVATVCDVRNDKTGACKFWRRAAKAGVPTAMFKLGLHLYKGDLHALGRNAEDAVMWLHRFVAASDGQVRIQL